MSKFNKKEPPLSVTAQAFSLCQLLSHIESEDGIVRSVDAILQDLARNCEVSGLGFVLQSRAEALTRLANQQHFFGLPPDEKKRMSAFVHDTITADWLRAARCVRRDDVRPELFGPKAPGHRTQLVSMLAVPMAAAGELVGTLVAFRAEIGAFCADDELYFQKIATLLAEDLQRAAAYLRLAKDPTTGFYTRRLFYDILMQESVRARRYQAPLSMLIFEIDTPAPIEAFLKRFSQRLVSEMRQSDILARCVDASLVALLPMTTLDNAHEVARRIRDHFVKYPIILNESAVAFGLSIGIASLEDSDDDGNAMLLRADRALSVARKGGPNKIEVYREQNERFNDK